MAQPRGENTRTRIIGSAMRLFAEKGYDATGVAEVCADSGASKGAFYHHFRSKQELFLTLLEEWLKGVDAGLGRALEAAESVPDGLIAMAAETRDVFAVADGKLGIFLEFWEQARHDPTVWKEFIAPYRRYREYFAKIVQRGMDEGSLRKVDPEVAGQALVAMAVGIVVQGVLDPRGAQWDEVARDAVKLLIDGMSATRRQ